MPHQDGDDSFQASLSAAADKPQKTDPPAARTPAEPSAPAQPAADRLPTAGKKAAVETADTGARDQESLPDTEKFEIVNVVEAAGEEAGKNSPPGKAEKLEQLKQPEQPTEGVSAPKTPEAAHWAEGSGAAAEVRDRGPVFQIAETVLKNAPEGRSSFKMKLHPEGLGEVSVTMACLKEEFPFLSQPAFPDTGRLLESRTDLLKSALADKNLVLTNVEVRSGLDAGGGTGANFGAFGGNGKWQPESAPAVELRPQTAADADTPRYMSAPAGRLNYIA
jgi:hypothetical protein